MQQLGANFECTLTPSHCDDDDDGDDNDGDDDDIYLVNVNLDNHRVIGSLMIANDHGEVLQYQNQVIRINIP